MFATEYRILLDCYLYKVDLIVNSVIYELTSAVGNSQLSTVYTTYLGYFFAAVLTLCLCSHPPPPSSRHHQSSSLPSTPTWAARAAKPSMILQESPSLQPHLLDSHFSLIFPWSLIKLPKFTRTHRLHLLSLSMHLLSPSMSQYEVGRAAQPGPLKAYYTSSHIYSSQCPVWAVTFPIPTCKAIREERKSRTHSLNLRGYWVVLDKLQPWVWTNQPSCIHFPCLQWNPNYMYALKYIVWTQYL